VFFGVVIMVFHWFISGAVVIAGSSVVVVLHPCWVGSLEEDRGD